MSCGQLRLVKATDFSSFETCSPSEDSLLSGLASDSRVFLLPALLLAVILCSSKSWAEPKWLILISGWDYGGLTACPLPYH